MSLEVKVGDLVFKNPIIVGSAGYAEDENGIKRFIKRGYAGVVTKSTSKDPLSGAPPPRVFWYDPYRKLYLDWDEAHRNPGIEKMAEHIKACKSVADKENCHIIGSISCNTIDEGVYVATKFYEAGVSAIEIDMQCPAIGPHLGPEYATRGGSYWGDPEHPERAIELIKALKSAVDVPIWPKIATISIYLTGEVIEKSSNPDAYVYMGYTFPFYPLGLALDLDTGRPIFNGNTMLKIKKGVKFKPHFPGALPLLPTTVLATALLRRKLKTPLVPSGGIMRGFDVIQAMMAGGSAVEVCTAIYRDIDIIENMLREIRWYMNKKGIDRLSEIIGISIENIPFDLMEIPIPRT